MNRQRIALVCAGLIAVSGAYLLGRAGGPAALAERSGAMSANPAVAASADERREGDAAPPTGASAGPGPLPRAGAPLKDSFAQLQARAQAGDAMAATRLVRDLDRCSRLGGERQRSAAAAGALLDKDPAGMTPAQLRTHQLLLDAMAQRQGMAQEGRALCAGVDRRMLDALIPSIAQAARLGDADARACYLGRGPLYDARSLLAHPEALRAYRNDATSMIRSGLAAGDWRVVDLLQQAHAPGAQGLLAAAVDADPVRHYRYLRLYRLGAEPHRVAKLDPQLAAAAARLTSPQRAAADAWAQATLESDFQGSSTGATPLGWEPCAF